MLGGVFVRLTKPVEQAHDPVGVPRWQPLAPLNDEFRPFATASGADSNAGERSCTEAIAGASSQRSKASGTAKHAVAVA